MSGLSDLTSAYEINCRKLYLNWFTINVFYSDQWKQNGLVFVNPGLLKNLLNLNERDISYTFKSSLNTPRFYQTVVTYFRLTWYVHVLPWASTKFFFFLYFISFWVLTVFTNVQKQSYKFYVHKIYLTQTYYTNKNTLYYTTGQKNRNKKKKEASLNWNE